MSATDMPATPWLSTSSANMRLALDGLADHRGDPVGEVVVEQVGLLLAHLLDHGEGEVHVAALVAEHPVGARRPGR